MLALSALPSHPGIYALVNHAAKLVYIGQTMNLCYRYGSWVAYLAKPDSPHRHHAVFDEAFPTTNASDWKFVVLHELPGATREQLTELEGRAIRKSRLVVGGRVLNSTFGAVQGIETEIEPKRAHKGRQPKTTILKDGAAMTYASAAAELGCPMSTLYARLRDYRERGISAVTIQELVRLREKYRPKGKQ